MLTVKVLRIEDVLWNSLFMNDIPGATMELDNGLFPISISALFLPVCKRRTLKT
jgi:hypothetical protein